MNGNYDLIIVGAGPVGCVIAERAATRLGWTSLVLEKRNHIAGNCYDRVHESGVLIHPYGPHYFRTNNPKLLDYLSNFTDWIPGNYRVKADRHGELFPFPINLSTLEQFYGVQLDEESGRELLERVREKIAVPVNSEEFVLSRVGRQLYEAFYLGYTLKQWGRHPRELDPGVCGRIPVRFNRDDRYVDHEFQLMPKDGFTALFAKMLDHPKIEVRLNTDFREVRAAIKPRRRLVYCGPIDEYFDCHLGRLPWRSLRFEFREDQREYVQPCVQINYPVAHAYTRSVEIKHVTAQKCTNTVVSYEYPTDGGDPYYPVPAKASADLCRHYERLAEAETRRHGTLFCGRLARYRYINTDEAIESALECFEQIRKDASL